MESCWMAEERGNIKSKIFAGSIHFSTGWVGGMLLGKVRNVVDLGWDSHKHIIKIKYEIKLEGEEADAEIPSWLFVNVCFPDEWCPGKNTFLQLVICQYWANVCPNFCIRLFVTSLHRNVRPSASRAQWMSIIVKNCQQEMVPKLDTRSSATAARKI